MVQEANDGWIPIAFNICIPMHKLTDEDLLDNDEFFEVEWVLYDLQKKWKILRYGSPLVAVRDKGKESTYTGNKWWCTAGVAACIVSSSWKVFPCPFLRIEAWNIFKEELKDIWLESSIFNAFRQREKFEWACKWCAFLSYCGWCRWRAYKLTGKLNGSDPKCYKERFLQSK
jgi:radical SAM protein with 4Fe4S-binding SPASM domain